MQMIWIADDDRSIRWVLQKALNRESIPSRVFENAEDVLEALQAETPAVLVSDIRMGDVSGTDLLREVKKSHPDVPVVMMTAFSDMESAVSSFEGGADEYLTKPFDVDKAISLLKRFYEKDREETDRASRPLPETKRALEQEEELVGQSRIMQEVFRTIARMGASKSPVLLTGESGTGKSLIARVLHKHSVRKNAPFVSVNMTAIPAELLETEIFGREGSAYAIEDDTVLGAIERADGGTLFLDHVEQLSLTLQSRLLRLVSEGLFYRVSGRKAIPSDVRLITASTQSLETLVQTGAFREDLFHRLNVIHLRVPALRDRLDDVGILCDCFLTRAANRLNVEHKRLSKEAMRLLTQYSYPGNVRELENLCSRLAVMSTAQTIDEDDLPNELRLSRQSRALDDAGKWTRGLRCDVQKALLEKRTDILDRTVADIERILYTEALRYTHGKKVQAAEALGVGRNTITRKLKELGITEND